MGETFVNSPEIRSFVEISGNLNAVRAIAYDTAKYLQRPCGGRRGKIGNRMSPRSWCRMVWRLNCITTPLPWFVTLTYHDEFPASGVLCKIHLKEFLRRIKVSTYFWVLEAQQRGAPHFHLALGEKPPSEFHVLSIWQSVVGDSSITQVKVEKFRKPPAAYFGKEAGKRCQKRFPKGFAAGRFWGQSRNLETLTEVHEVTREMHSYAANYPIRFLKP